MKFNHTTLKVAEKVVTRDYILVQMSFTGLPTDPHATKDTNEAVNLMLGHAQAAIAKLPKTSVVSAIKLNPPDPSTGLISIEVYHKDTTA